MGNISLNTTTVDETIDALNKIAGDHAANCPAKFYFKGDFAFTHAAGELRDLMEQTRVLWYTASGVEAAILKDTKNAMSSADKQLGRMIGGGS